MRGITDDAGRQWDVVIGKESWGTLVLLFTPREGGGTRTTTLAAETPFAAHLELDNLSDDDLRDRLRGSRPWP
jgi:hypothetical protein